jgi:hypothetical protein
MKAPEPRGARTLRWVFAGPKDKHPCKKQRTSKGRYEGFSLSSAPTAWRSHSH